MQWVRHEHDPLRQILTLFSADPACSLLLEMSDTAEEQYQSDYSYDNESDVDDDFTNEEAVGLNVGDIQEEEVEAFDEEAEEPQEEEDDGRAAAPMEYEPSFNRGPGALDAREAGIFRNQVSNLQTSIKKRKVRDSTTENVARRNINVMQLVGGDGMVTAGYLGGRNYFSNKGCPIGPKHEETRRAIYKDECDKLEDVALDVMPKFKVGGNNKKGKNQSPSLSTHKAVQAGLKSELQDLDIGPNRAINMAGLGVKFVNSMVAKLEKCKPEGAHVTKEETIAACQLSLFNAFNCNLDEDSSRDFDPVNNDLLYDHAKVLKKRRRFDD